jgi:hypothetical protein
MAPMMQMARMTPQPARHPGSTPASMIAQTPQELRQCLSSS